MPIRIIQNKPLTKHGNRKRPSSVRLLKRFAKVEVFGDDEPHLVDLDVAEEVAKHRWSAVGKGYAGTRIGDRIVYLHQFVFGTVLTGLEIDHRDRDRSNSCSENLHVVTRSLNRHNSCSRGKSPYKGVSWNKEKRKWRTRIIIDSREHHLGYFTDEEDAARAFDEAAKAHYGDNAFSNFPEPKRKG